MKNSSLLLLLLLWLVGCSKNEPNLPASTDGFVKYSIAQGDHYCDQNTLKQVSVSSMNFAVRFDSSAIYTTVDPSNQDDINKLYGFSEGLDHHVNSARIGWSYNKAALRLYAYAYKNGDRSSKEITPISIGEVHTCSIRVLPSHYEFSVDGKSVSLEREKSDEIASGFQLYPYFGGDEVAPHLISIYIKAL